MPTSDDIESGSVYARAASNSAPMSAPARQERGHVVTKHSPVFLGVFTLFLFSTTFLVALTLLSVLSAQPAHHDTLWFWESGRLLVHGQNPYDRETLRQIELAMGVPLKGNDVLMTLNPPFAFVLLMPLGLLGPRQAALAWSLFLALCLGLSVRAIRKAAGSSESSGYLWLAYFFPAAMFCIWDGQTGLITLLGLALFFEYHEERPIWAGAALSLCAVKPHLLLPFGAVLLVWAVTRKRWLVIAGAVLALAVESVIAMFLDHAIWTHYRAMVRTEPFTAKMIPTLGVGLRLLIDRRALWLEFVPAGLAIIWGIWYFLRNRNRWDWRTHGSVLTLVSLIVAPYAWVTDQVIVIPAMLFVMVGAKRPKKGSLTLLLAIMVSREVAAMITGSLFGRVDIEIDTAFSLVWLAWYLYATSGRVVPSVQREAIIAT